MGIAMARQLLLGGVGCLCVVVFSFVLLPEFMPTPLGGYADQRFILLVLSGFLLAGSFVYITFLRHGDHISLVSTLLPFSMFSLAFPLLSIPYHEQPYIWSEPGMYAFYFTALGFTGAVLASFRVEYTYTKFLPFVVALACCLYGAMSVNIYLFAVFDGVTDLVDFLPWGFVNIRYWSHIATWFLPLVPLAVLAGPLKDQRLWRVLVALGAGAWWWMVFLSVARGSLVSILFSTCLIIILFGRQAFPWLKTSTMYLLIGVIFWGVLSVFIPSLIADSAELRSVSGSSGGRVPLFVEAWSMSLQNFPFGMGAQSWLTHELLTDTYRHSTKFGHPHNMYLMWAAEYGWILIAILGLVIIQVTKYFLRRRKQVLDKGPSERVFILIAFTASVSAALVHAGVSAVFLAPGSMLVGLFIMIGFWAIIYPEVDQNATIHWGGLSRRRYAMTILVIPVIVTVWALWMTAVIKYYNAMRLDEPYYQEHVTEGTYPRFWFHGNFPRPEYDMSSP